MFSKIKKYLLSMSLLVLVAACGNGSSSSDNVADGASSGDSSGGATTSSNGRAAARLSSNKAVAGQPMSVSFDLGDTGNNLARAKGAAGTIHWGDNTGERISGNGSVSHTYMQSGTYKINIRVDGGPVTRVGSITVSSAPSVDPTFEERLQKIIDEANGRFAATQAYLARANRILSAIRAKEGRSRNFISARSSRNQLRNQRNNARRARNRIRNSANNAIAARNAGNIRRARNQYSNAFSNVRGSERAITSAQSSLRDVISRGQSAGVSID